MSTATIERTDIEPVILEEQETEDICQALGGCDREAEWYEVMACCGSEYPLCDPHKIYDEVYYKQHATEAWTMTCRVCGFQILGDMMMAIISWRRK